jgi:thiol:disulfide interchange protein DsbD
MSSPTREASGSRRSRPARLALIATVLTFAVLAVTSPLAHGQQAPGLVWQFSLRADHRPGTLERILATARAAHRPVLIHTTASWCAACRVLDRETWRAPPVIAAAERFITVRIDVSDDAARTAAPAAGEPVRAVPTIVLLSSRGEVLTAHQVLGTLSPAALVERLGRVP